VIDMDDYLNSVERQLAQLTEQGAHRRVRARFSRAGADAPPLGSAGADRRRAAGSGRHPRPPRRRADVLAIGSAVLVTLVVAAVVINAGFGSGKPSSNKVSGTSRTGTATVTNPATTNTAPSTSSRTTTTTTTSAQTSASATASGPSGPVPSGFGAQSFTAISELTWWLLGSAPCSSPPCTSIVRTDDGGRTFVGVPAPRTSGVSQLRFADPHDGFAFDPELWTTHDAGATWTQIDVGGTVTELAVGQGYVYAIVRSGNGSGRLLRAPITGGTWSVLPGAGDAYGGLWTHGDDVLLEGATKPGLGNLLMVSHDSGSTFSHYAVPPSVACHFEEPQTDVIWTQCATGMLSGVWRSTDGGRTWVPSATAAGGSGGAASGLPEMPNSASFAAASPTSAVVGYRQLYVTTDGGSSYQKVSGPTGITWWQYLGFTDATHGVALGYAGSTASAANERLYYTTDGGHSYHLVAVR
jgi:hypothetical protein